MKERSLRTLFFANTLTAVGTALIFIPLGNLLTPHLGVGRAFSFLLVLSKAPLVLGAPIYARLARHWGIARVIAASQGCAVCFSGAAIWGVQQGSFPILLCGLVGLSFSSSALNSLFPGFLHGHSKSPDQTESLFSKWYFLQHLALVLSTLVGAYLEGWLSSAGILSVDALTFLATALIWTVYAIRHEETAAAVDLPHFTLPFVGLSAAGFRFQSINLARNFFYGFANPLFPVLVLEWLGGTSIQLGYLYVALGAAALLGARSAPRLQFTSLGFVRNNIAELTLLCAALLAPQLWIAFTLGFSAVLLMAINEVKLQLRFFESQPKSESVASSASFEQTYNLGALGGYAFYNLVPAVLLLPVLLLLGGGLAVSLYVTREQTGAGAVE